jgi:hypothetical protein
VVNDVKSNEEMVFVRELELPEGVLKFRGPKGDSEGLKEDMLLKDEVR